MFSKTLHKFQQSVFTIITIFTWLLYIIIALGLSASAPNYLDDLQYYTKIYVSLFLLLRFNPFRQIKFTELDREIAFSAGVFLLATTAINSFLINNLKKIKVHLL